MGIKSINDLNNDEVDYDSDGPFVSWLRSVLTFITYVPVMLDKHTMRRASATHMRVSEMYRAGLGKSPAHFSGGCGVIPVVRIQ